MNVEKALRNYLKGKGPKVKANMFYTYAIGNGNATFNVLFKLVNEEIDTMTDSKILDRVVEVLKLGEILIRNDDGLNRKAIARKIVRLQQKLDTILEEGKRKFSNLKKIKSEFNKVQRELEILLEMNEEKDTKQYDFMAFLIEEIKNMDYLEYTLKKTPSLANVKDKDEISLFQKIVHSFISSLEQENDEDSLYYENIIVLLLSQKSFQMTETEKRDCLEDIYKYINQCSYNKKNEKQNKKRIEKITQLVDKIKGVHCETKNLKAMADKYKIHIFFQPALMEQMQVVKEAKEGKMTNRVMVDDYVVSIDKGDTIEIDDTLSCRLLPNGNCLLGIHIASVLGYFPYESDIVQEAIYRNQSIYLPHRYQNKEDDFNRVIPIFPYMFAADKGSLVEGEKRLTRSYYFEITSTGEVVDEKFIKTIVKNGKRLTYDEANIILEKGSNNPQLQSTIQLLEKATSLSAGKYKVSELYDKIKENTSNASELRVKKVGSENIVYQAMLLTGNRVADFFYRNNYPCLYRVHEVNEENNRKLQSMIDTLNETYGGEQFKNLYQLIEGIYPRGWYATSGRHDGLGLDHHCHCTSTLRRAADIVMEHALEVCVDQTPTENDLEKLREEIASKAVEINARQTPIDYFIKDYSKRYHHR